MLGSLDQGKEALKLSLKSVEMCVNNTCQDVVAAERPQIWAVDSKNFGFFFNYLFLMEGYLLYWFYFCHIAT